MSIENATTDAEYEDLVASLAPMRRQWPVGSSAIAPRIQQWIRSTDADADTDIDTDVTITMVSLAVDREFRERAAGGQDKEMFLRLIEQWRAERAGAVSSMAEIIACPSYLRIIGMGWRVLPLIIEQLEREGDEPDHWCAALEAVTGEDPVPEDAYGDTVRIAQAWIAWNETRIAWSFRTSTTRTIESPATGLIATTASPGPRNLM
jgi:hypothetical protein